MIFIETLVYIVRDGKVLLIKKKRGLGAGFYNGIGGKVEEGEDVVTAAIRECEEEVDIRPRDLRWSGLLEFWNYEDGKVESIHFVHIFLASEFEGEPRETDEALPVWFSISEVPYDEMWEDDRLWLPRVLNGGTVYGRFEFVKWRLVKSEVYELRPLK
jgi:8-oxo-dGTP diphosphatase